MYLKRLEIYGFKSFGTRSVLDFAHEKDFSQIAAIVGPNGSGKSNIADAVRWVLGEQSTKNLRSKKSEDVIFVGSSTKPRSSYAEILILLSSEKEVEFEINNKKYKTNEIEVGRKLYRSGESEYLINRKKVRLVDIHQVLASLGFGQSSYTVIGQGMVDRLLFFNASERKVLFDEAAGVKQYEIKREQSIRRLEGTDANLIRLKDILTELEPRVTNLRRLVKRAEGRKEIEVDLTQLQSTYYSNYLYELNGKLENFEKEKAELNKKIVQLGLNIDEIDRQISIKSDTDTLGLDQIKIEKSLNEKTKERDEAARAALELENKLNQLEYRSQIAKKEAERLEAEKTTLNEKIEFLNKKIADAYALHELDEKNRLDLAREIEIIEKEKDKLAKDLEKITNNGENKVDDKLEGELAYLETKSRDLSGQIFTFEQSERHREQKEIENSQKKARLESELFSFDKKIEIAKNDLQDLALSGSKGNKAKALLEVRLKKIETGLIQIEEQLSELNLHLDEDQVGLFEKELLTVAGEIKGIQKKIDEGKNAKELLAGFWDKIDQVFGKIRKFTSAIKKSERSKLEDSLRQEQQKRREIEVGIHQLEFEAEKRSSKTQILDQEIAGYEKRKREIESELDGLTADSDQGFDPVQIEGKKVEIAKINKKIEEISSRLREQKRAVDDQKQVILTTKNELHEKESHLRRKIYELDLSLNQKKSLAENQKREVDSTKGRIKEIDARLAENVDFPENSDILIQLEKRKNELQEKNAELAMLRGKLSELMSAGREQNQLVLELERKRRTAEIDIMSEKEKLNLVEVEKAGFQARAEDLVSEINSQNILVDTTHKREILSQNEKDIIKAKIENLKRRLETIGGVDPETVAEYEELNVRNEEMSSQVVDLEKAKGDLEKVIRELDGRIKRQFADTFGHIAAEFDRYFRILFNGGKATLTLGTDEEGNYGIEISANPPGKKLQNLGALSGGERTLTSLALLFAILQVNPSPFCVLDEVDAALDESNTLRFAKILQDLAIKTQFLVISHNRETMRAADSLYGITMGEDNMSKLISIRLAEALEKVAK